MILLESSHNEKLYDKALPFYKNLTGNIFMGIFSTILIVAYPLPNLIDSGNIVAISLYMILYIILFILFYIGTIALFNYYRHIKYRKKYQAESISINDDSIVFNYNDRKIEFRFGNVIKTQSWILDIKDDYISFDMANCFICCENKCNHEQLENIKRIFKKIKESKPGDRYKESNLNMLMVINDTKDMVSYFICRGKLIYLINVLLIAIFAVEIYLGYSFGISYIATLTGLAAFFLSISNITQLLLDLSKLKQVKKIYFDDKKYYVLDKNGFYIDCLYDNIMDTKKFKNTVVINTFNIGYMLVANENNLHEMMRKINKLE